MAFAYTTDGYDKKGKVSSVWGTWNATGVTSGNISFGPLVGNSIKVIDANLVTASTANTTSTAWKLTVGTATVQPIIAVVTTVSNDSGNWTASWI